MEYLGRPKFGFLICKIGTNPIRVAWMTGSKLKLNPSKTEFLLIGTKFQREKFLNNFPCLILGQDTNPSASAKNLGVVFDSSLNFRKHISQTCRACFYLIRDLRRIRKSLGGCPIG